VYNHNNMNSEQINISNIWKIKTKKNFFNFTLTLSSSKHSKENMYTNIPVIIIDSVRIAGSIHNSQP